MEAGRMKDLLLFALSFLFVGVPIIYWLSWEIGLDAGLSTVIGFLASFIFGLMATRILYGKQGRRSRTR